MSRISQEIVALTEMEDALTEDAPPPPPEDEPPPPPDDEPPPPDDEPEEDGIDLQVCNQPNCDPN